MKNSALAVHSQSACRPSAIAARQHTLANFHLSRGVSSGPAAAVHMPPPPAASEAHDRIRKILGF